MNNLPLQPLVWFDGGDTYGGDDLHADSPLHYYVVEKDTLDSFTVRYTPNHGAAKYATGFATIDEAKAWAWKHYNEKMQPYVKPLPTWFNYETEKPTQGDSIVIAWVWMSDNHTIWLESYSPAEIDYLDDCLEVYWSFSPFKSEVTK